jgi:hypothetical protein
VGEGLLDNIAGIAAHHYLGALAQAGQAGQRRIQQLDVIGGGVRLGMAGSQPAASASSVPSPRSTNAKSG